MKIKKSQLKELIKQEIEEYKKTLEEILPSISETIEVEEGKMDALKKIASKQLSYRNLISQGHLHKFRITVDWAALNEKNAQIYEYAFPRYGKK